MLIDTALESDRKWLTAEKVTRMPRLKFIQSLRAGVDAIDSRAVAREDNRLWKQWCLF